MPLDANFLDDEKILNAGERAGWLYVAMLCRAKQLSTDGYLTERQIARLHVSGWRDRLDALVSEQAVWKTEDGRYWITGWPKWNEPMSQVEERRKKDRERKAADRGHGSAGNPAGIRADSSPKRREEKRKDIRPPGQPVDNCPHDAPARPPAEWDSLRDDLAARRSKAATA